MNGDLNDLYNAARPTIGRDPLVLDLDGDGIEAIGINSANPILFDHNADTVKTATGWIKADDGILVLDRNGNGTIDSGRELFGDNTLLTTGAYAGLHAANGFQALADLDTNADKKIDSADAAYAQLRIWQDTNQDGISQAGELKTLTQLGIASISTVGVASNINLGNGNTQPLSATFTKTNGTTGTAGTTVLTDGQSGSLILASNNFYREFTDNPVVTTAAGALPQMQGSGWVRDLREAMSLGTPQATALQTQVEAFAAGTTRDAQMAVLEDLLVSWADTTGSRMLSIGKYSFVPGEGGMTTANYSYNANGFALLLLPQDMGHIETLTGGAQILHLTSAGVQVLYKVNVLEVFNGTKFITAPPMAPRVPEGSTAPPPGGGGGGGISGESVVRGQLSTAQIVALTDSYAVLKESVYASLIMQTRLKPYLDSIELVIDANGIRFDTAAMQAMLQAKYAGHTENGLTDLVDLNKFALGTLDAVGFNGLALLKTWVDAVPAGSPLAAKLVDMGVFKGAAVKGTVTNDIYMGDAANNTFRAGAGDDSALGGAGNDSLFGEGGDDTLLGEVGDDALSGDAGNDNLNGGDGADTLNGGAGSDTLVGGAGNDTLYSWGSLGGGDLADQDSLDGGAGNDYLVGGMGNDTYWFGRGDGQDSINNWANVIVSPSNLAGKKDVLRFKAGVASSDVTLSRVNDNLVIKINGSTDQVTITSYFTGDGVSVQGYAVDEIRFTDESTVVWTVADVKVKTIAGTAGADTLTGYATNDSISGGDGNDTIYGRAGNDSLDGGAGNDTLEGEAGADTLNGGDGVDILNGGAGSDTLVGGAGNDALNSAGSLGGGDLGDADSLDGGAGNDSLMGGMGNDTYWFGRGDGQDSINNWANPLISLPSLVGKKDVLRFKAGVASADVTLSRVNDTLVIKINGTTDQVTIFYYFTGDGVSTQGYAVDEIRFTDEPTVVWTVADVKVKTIAGTAGADTLTGYATNDSISGGDGNDTIYGRAGNDSLDGGAGNDTLEGEAGADTLNGGDGVDILHGGTGSDTLVGGAGNDTLNSAGSLGGGDLGDVDSLDGGAGNDSLVGGMGNDTYWFGRGDGQDSINNWANPLISAPSLVGKKDVLRFKAGVASADVTLSRVNDTLVIKINGTTDQVTIFYYFTGDGVSTQGYALDEIRFTDEPTVVWTVSDVKVKVLVPTAGADTLTGYATNDTLSGGDGSDTLYGRDGNDTLNGNAGDDALNGEAGADSLNGGDGVDTLTGGLGADTLVGGAGNDNLYGDTGFAGGGSASDNDSLDGGVGNDNLVGGMGNDTYWFGRGDGQDTINNAANAYDGAPVLAGKKDVLRFKAGIASSDVSLARVGDNLIIKINGSTDQVTISGYFTGDGVSAQGYAVDEIRFADEPTVVWVLADVKTKVTVSTAGADILTGYATNDTLSGGLGNDTLYGRDGADTLNGDAGDDMLSGDAGADTLNGGDGVDTLNGGLGADILVGGAGNDNLYGMGVYGGGGVGDDDSLDGGAGNDSLVGGMGSDTYWFGRGDGQDALSNYADAWNGTADPTAGKKDVLRFKAGVASSDVTVSRVGENLVVKINGTTDQVTISNYFISDGVSTQGYAVEEIRFTDEPGVVWTVADVKLKVISGTVSSDMLVGYAGNDTLSGGAGNDTMSGRAGNDTLDGGTGNDSLMGEAGNDTYLFGRGDGQDSVTDNDATVGNVDKVVFKAGVAVADVVLTRSGNSLVIKINGTTDQMTVTNYYSDATFNSYGIEQITFTDAPGVVWNVADVRARTVVSAALREVILSNDHTGGNNGQDDWFQGTTYSEPLHGAVEALHLKLVGVMPELAPGGLWL